MHTISRYKNDGIGSQSRSLQSKQVLAQQYNKRAKGISCVERCTTNAITRSAYQRSGGNERTIKDALFMMRGLGLLTLASQSQVSPQQQPRPAARNPTTTPSADISSCPFQIESEHEVALLRLLCTKDDGISIHLPCREASVVGVDGLEELVDQFLASCLFYCQLASGLPSLLATPLALARDSRHEIGIAVYLQAHYKLRGGKAHGSATTYI